MRLDSFIFEIFFTQGYVLLSDMAKGGNGCWEKNGLGKEKNEKEVKNR